jgi:glycosyltransferase involved in cell wall biosynthesis
LKKVLLISYFFPPCEMTSSRRVESWAKELSKLGYEVHVLTRKWDHPVRSFKDIHLPTSEGTSTSEIDGYKVTAVPYIPNYRDRLLTSSKMTALRKLLTVKELIFQNIFLSSCPFANMCEEAERIVKEEQTDLVVISGNPFIQFKFGHRLNKKFGVKWIADYRDAWTTSTINHLGRSVLYKFYQRYDRYFEKKWVKTASLITASSDDIGDSITELTDVKSKAIYNGFDENLFNDVQDVLPIESHFQIVYVGTLYFGQDITIFLDAYKRFIDQKQPNAQLLFPGLAADPIQLKRIENEMVGYESYMTISERVPHKEVLKIEKESHVLLHVAWKEHKGIIASKIYEYIGSGTSVLIAPGDNGAIDKVVSETEIGAICHTSEDVEQFLHNGYDAFLTKTKTVPLSESNRSIEKYTRQSQARELELEIRKLVD